MWACGGDKASSPYGFTFLFVIRYFTLLQLYVFSFTQQIFNIGSIRSTNNSTFFTLISKVSNPIDINDIRLNTRRCMTCFVIIFSRYWVLWDFIRCDLIGFVLAWFPPRLMCWLMVVSHTNLTLGIVWARVILSRIFCSFWLWKVYI